MYNERMWFICPREDKTKQAFEMIEQSVHNIYESENFKNYLHVLSKFHNYSLNNVILILSQYPTASLVAGYNSWRDNFHRYVNKGEKAIRILAPYQVNVKKILEDTDEQGNKIQTEEDVKVTKFRIVNVFDISQTNGEPIADLNLVNELKGTSNNARALIAAINEICTIPIELKHAQEDPTLEHGAKGYYSITEDKIVINSDLEDIQIAKTLSHEYAHSILHKDTKRSQSQREIEAESLAFVICDHFDIDTSEYSFGYVASYAMNNQDQLKDILKNIQSNAKEIINSIEPLFERDLLIFNTTDRYFSPVEMEKISSGLINDLMMDIDGTGLKDVLKYSDFVDHESIQLELDNLLSKYEDKYPEAIILYDKNKNFREGIHETLYQRCAYDIYDPQINRPMLEMSQERLNYNKLSSMAKPLLEGNVTYCKLSSGGLMDFNIEVIGDNQIALSHYGELNGDAMADPDIVFTVDKENKLLIPESYQNDYMNVYQSRNDDAHFCNDVNQYTSSWLNNIKECNYRFKEIHTDEECYSMNENASDLYKFCKENDIQKYAINPNHKEKER